MRLVPTLLLGLRSVREGFHAYRGRAHRVGVLEGRERTAADLNPNPGKKTLATKQRGAHLGCVHVAGAHVAGAHVADAKWTSAGAHPHARARARARARVCACAHNGDALPGWYS